MFKPLLSFAMLLGLTASTSGAQPGALRPSDIRVLDGDTFLVGGMVVKLAGVDAPELGPWARCWAEAALAGHARTHLESVIYRDPERGPWRLADLSPASPDGRRTARVVRADGGDIGDDMVVYGYAAATDGRWDWCGENANLRPVRDDSPRPYGPNLWWPSNHMYDPRAAD